MFLWFAGRAGDLCTRLTGREPNSLVATGVDLDRFEALFAERVLAGV